LADGLLDTVVVGAGQAGLGTSYFLQRSGRKHVVFERGRIGETWLSQRWDSFQLNTLNIRNTLPGFPYEGTEPDGFWRHDELVAYFQRYAGVRTFRERLLNEVRQAGTTRTLFGRRRPIPEINARNTNQRNYAERTALNSPLQGTAADIIKLAMIRLDERLRAEKLRTRMILQVHDELLFEVPEDEVERARKLVKAAMETIEFPRGRAYPLKVPLVVEVGAGPHWAAVK